MLKRLLKLRTQHPLLQVPRILKISGCGVRIKPEPVKPVKISQSENYYDEKNMEIGRPLTPFISIYATQLQGVMSISNRISGAVWTFQMFTFAVAALVLPESVEYYVDQINSWNIDPIAIFVGKCLVAWPMVYHTFDGTRHILWDFGLILTNRSVAISGWIVVIISVTVTLYLSLVV
ncbi:succinate dehydrogenase cytochrome b560 subunit, mitochondrial-like isoform X2 [Harmonia axyridis]|uniref:succinate dehydrogenase cytochrome b560 subunit, mitochondrial-like isoform X2 n=1 Tax=Harmonia axyridis TaxID=115357 RepID=UPI001E275D56|nr:succinate dehydrogenase cytochrome b560 subunit, mitochondrial-like isoform X2 [Harmonia axyridis]